ncbi:Wzz/FepE/Etk N-terminal domain-containing protein, partial [Klebsiella pneumoniae]
MASMKNKISSENTEQVDLGRLIGEFIDHRKLIISVTSLFTLLALVYAIFATPVYQANALIQVEQKQANAILSNLSQMLPDSQPQSAPEIALLQSRMVIGKTVDDLNLQTRIRENYFPVVGKGLSRLMGKVPGEIDVSRFYLKAGENEQPKINLTVIDDNHFKIEFDGDNINGV